MLNLYQGNRMSPSVARYRTRQQECFYVHITLHITIYLWVTHKTVTQGSRVSNGSFFGAVAGYCSNSLLGGPVGTYR